MKKVENLGISSYYRNLAHGEKDSFVREVAEAIGKSTSTILTKRREGRWAKTEIPAIDTRDRRFNQ